MPKNIKFDDYPEFVPNLTPFGIMKWSIWWVLAGDPTCSSVTENYKNQHKKNINGFRWKIIKFPTCDRN
jgi:hypothetical protein